MSILWKGEYAFCITVAIICDALQEKVTYVGKHNFAVEWKITGNLKKVEFQVLRTLCTK